MGIVLICIFLLVGLTALFKKTSEWFWDNKNINILPGAVIKMIAILILAFSYGGHSVESKIWMFLAIITILIVVILNLTKHGFKDGLLASAAELVFSIAAAFLIANILIGSNNTKKKRK